MRTDNKNKKKHKNRRRKLYERIADFCEVPADMVSNVPVFEIRGHHEIEITGCDGILEYNDRIIILTVGRDRFTVTGEFLVLSDFRDNVLFVRGNIKSASFGVCDGCEGGMSDA
ncbi:MAG: YabP/YqfC family sporulation protein [Eubacteriales bacterium]